MASGRRPDAMTWRDIAAGHTEDLRKRSRRHRRSIVRHQLENLPRTDSPLRRRCTRRFTPAVVYIGDQIPDRIPQIRRDIFPSTRLPFRDASGEMSPSCRDESVEHATSRWREPSDGMTALGVSRLLDQLAVA